MMKNVSAKEYANSLSNKFKNLFVRIKNDYHPDELPEWKIKELNKEGKCYFVYDFYGNRDIVWTNKGGNQ